MTAFVSPRLIVDRYVLHRLPMPRHSPCALISLTFCQNYVSYLVIVNFLNVIVVNIYPFLLKKTFDICLISLFHFTFTCIQFSRYIFHLDFSKLVGLRGLEPPTSRLSGVRSNHLSYKPMFLIRSCESLKRIGIRFFLKPLVEICGIEPQTPCLQSRCSPS